MMAQFIEIKGANPDYLLFYRMGDFYELFFDDAEIASRALGITLTKRGKHLGEDIPMCGVPVHAAEDYLQKLIGLGHRVAVCEQTEDPAEAKKRGAKAVVRRDVTRLVTPGTITEEKLLDPSRSNFLAALARVRPGEGREELALAWIDLSTGAFHVCATSQRQLGADLARIEPSEIIVADTAFAEDAIRKALDGLSAAVSPQPAVSFDSAAATDRLKKYFGVATLDAFGEFGRAELAAAGAVLAYVEKTQIGERPALARPLREDMAGTMFIDAATRANLELVRTLSGERDGSLVRSIDRTATAPGSRLLAERLMNPLTDPAAIRRRHDAVGHLVDNDRLCRELAGELRNCPDMARALQRLSLNRGGPRDMGAIAAGLAGVARIAALLEGALPEEIETARKALADAPQDLARHLDKALDDELPLLRRDGGFIADGYHDELDELRVLSQESRKVIAQMQAQHAEETGIKSLKIRHNNVLGYFIEVSANHAGALTGEGMQGRFIHRQTMANAMRFTTTELAELETKIANAAGRALEIEQALFDALQAEILGHASSISAAAAALAALDVAGGLAKLAGERDYCRPLVDDTLAFDIEAGRHPVVEQVLAREGDAPFVANDCDIGADEGEEHGKVWLLTGPNMGGKSTFLRQNALIAIMAQMGSFVPAARAHIGVVDRLFSRVGAADDLARGRSTFMVEMIETAAILNQAGERAFVILDEIGRGTATFDGLSIAWATIEHLHEKNCCRALFATHYHELTALAEVLARLATVTMKVREWQGEVVFLHEVAPGAADRSYGIQVARLAGLPEAVVARARDVLDQLESSERSRPASSLLDDLPLFSAHVPAAPAPRETESELVKALAALAPDEMTPREALEKLYELRAMAKKGDGEA